MRNRGDYTILVVDDDPHLLETTVRVFWKSDYKVITAIDGASCMEILSKEKPDIILLDVVLPDISGQEVSKQIKSNPKFSSVYIILLSSLQISSDSVSEGLEGGADDFIRRPVSSRELLAKVQAACRIVSAERTILKNEMLLKACINSPNDMIVLAIDNDFNYLAFNKYHRDIMLKAYGVDIQLGMNLIACIKGEEDIRKAKINYSRAMKGECHITVEEYGELNRNFYETRYNPIFNENNQIIGATAFSADVTERKRIEISLQKSEEKFRKAFVTSPDSVNINRLSDGMYVSINEGFSKIMGYSEEEVIGKTSVELNIWADISDRDRLVKELKAVGKAENLEARFISKSGSLLYGIMSASVIDFDGVKHILSITRDISYRKAMEDALRNKLEEKRKTEKALKGSLKQLEINKLAMLNLLQDINLEMENKRRVEEEVRKLNTELELRVVERTRQFENANKELEAFAYSVSHDLRAPLRAIGGFSKFILEDHSKGLDEEGQRLFGLIRSNALKMDQLITDILALSRISRNELKRSAINMSSMVMSMYSECVPQEDRKNYEFVFSAMPDAYADPTYLKQVWTNLISNAVKFSSNKTKPTIKVGGYTESSFNIYFIKDNGAGFNPEFEQRLFGVFQRLHGPDEFEGTGIGLAIVQRIIHRHGGKVWAEGKENKGATFWFSLPLKSRCIN